MDNAYIVNAQTGQQMGRPVQFLRIPAVGELIWAPPQMYSVVRIVHGWLGGPSPAPVAAVHVAPATNLQANAATTRQVSPF